jgi:hypothetical protein
MALHACEFCLVMAPKVNVKAADKMGSKNWRNDR